ncbi:MAG: hypothetical protein SPL52_01085, partial [Fibrobacter sp.]|nr:hypothetical protein [Fibrobacter sp.]
CPDCGGEQVASAAIRSPYKKRGLCTKFLYKSLLTINTVCHAKTSFVATLTLCVMQNGSVIGPQAALQHSPWSILDLRICPTS